MRTINSILLLLCLCTVAAAQHEIKSPEHHHGREDSTDVFFRHMKLNELVVTGVTGDTKLKNSTAPISIINPRELRSTAAANVIDAIARQPGMSQLTTGSGISKPIIRGLGYNRVVVMSEGVRQEGQQWGDEHGIEVDGSAVNSVEILKGPASLMYGSDAMAGVVILHSAPTLAEGELQGNVSTEYQTNNGLFAYTLSMAGNQRGFVWDARFSDKMAHQYKNKYDGYVPGSQFHERAGRLMLGLNKQWGHSRLTWTAYHLTPSIIEGERDEATGVLTSHLSPLTSYSKSLPFQQVKHYKLVWDNALNLPSGYLKAIVGYQQNRRQEFEEEEGEEQGARGKEQGARGEGSEVRGDECLEPSLFFKMHTLTYDVRYLTSEWDGWKLSAGIGGMYQQSLNKGEEYLIPDYRLFDFGLYATVSKTLDRWTLNGGLRYDHRFLRGEGQGARGGGQGARSKEQGARGKEQGAGGEEQEGEELRFPDFSRHFNGVTGSVGAVWNASDHLNLRLNIARGFRTPNMSELASNGIHEGSLRYEVGNQQLKAEYSLQADLGLDFTSQYVSAQLALFANRIDNYIFLRGEERGARSKGRGARSKGQGARGKEQGARGEDYPVYSYTQGDAQLLGFEAGIDFHPVHSLHLGNTFSYVDARQLHQPDDTKYLPFTPAPRWTSELKWELAHHAHTTVGHRHDTDGSHHHGISGVALNNAYVAAGLECYLRQSHVYSADGTETPTPSYTLLNLSAGTDILIRGKKVAELYITANNLLNRAYQSHLSRLKYADHNTVTGRQGVYNMGRNVTFKVVVPIQF